MSKILDDTFAGTAVPPKNWTQLSGGPHDIAHTAGDVTLTDSTGNTTGILSMSAFTPVGTTTITTIKAHIIRVSEPPNLGNAIVGLVGLAGTNQTGSLAAGIDGQGNVFLVWAQANPVINQTLLVIGKDTNYTGGPTDLTFLVEQTFVQVLTPIKSKQYTYKQSLDNFSLKAAFKNQANPALVAASQPKMKSGVASFASINVSTG